MASEPSAPEEELRNSLEPDGGLKVGMSTDELQKSSMRDSLTGLFNRQYMEIEGSRLEAERKRGASDYAFAILDLDSFKASANDTYGHKTGDDILKDFADIVNNENNPEPVFRDMDIVGRWGGDEYVILMPDFDPDTDASEFSEELEIRLDTRLKELIKLKYPDLPELQNVGVSIGLAIPTEDDSAFGDIYKKADDALYQRKDIKGSARK